MQKRTLEKIEVEDSFGTNLPYISVCLLKVAKGMRMVFRSDVELERVPTGVPGLDSILLGGYLRAGVYIIQGVPGTGKTILANQFCFAQARNGGRGVFVTLLAESHSRMIQHLTPLSFFDASILPDRMSYSSAFSALENDGLKGLIDLLRREVRGQNATALVLDGFLVVEDVIPSAAALKKFISELQVMASVANCTVLLLTNARGRKNMPEHTMVDGLIELEEQIISPRTQNYLRVHKFRGSSFLRGHHAYNITADGMHVFPRLEAAYANTSHDAENGIEKLPSGIESLDEMLFGGIPASTSTALIGPTGACKTTMGLQFLSKATPADPGLFFGFFETPTLLCRKAASIGIDFPALEASGAVEIVWQVQGENQLDILGHRLLDAVERRGVKRLCVDSLDGLFQSATSPDRIHRFFAVLANELRAREVTAIFTLDTAGAYGAGTVQASGIASLFDNLILLRREERRSRMLRSVSVLKLRDSDFDTTVKEFSIDSNGISITKSLGEDGSSNTDMSSTIL